jgi:hypothetical protein
MKIPLAERLLRKLDTSGGPNACWLWTGGITRGGNREVEYGCIKGENGERWRVNRLVLHLCDPDGIEASVAKHKHEDAAHLCHFSLCGNPDHLEWQPHWINGSSQNLRKSVNI